MRRYLPVVLVSLAAILGAALLFIIFKPAQPAKTGFSIVAAENFYGSIAKQIAGERANVVSIINNPTDDPHLYESGAKDASTITSADIVIQNGLGYDDFIDKILQGSPNSERQVINIATLLQSPADANPHLWYDAQRIGQVAQAITDALAAKDPAGKETYQKNLNEFNNSLSQINNKVSAIRQNYAGAPVAYTERVAEYLIKNADLSIKTPATFASAIEDGNEPSPADQNVFLQLIESKQIRALIYNPQTQSPATVEIKNAAEQAGIPIVAMTETMPNDDSYQSWQGAQLDALTKALENNK